MRSKGSAPVTNSELFDQLESRFRSDVDARGDLRSLVLLTEVVTQFIPIGTPLAVAKAKLEQSGFRIVKRNDPDPGFEERYDAVRMSKQYWTIVSSYEFAVVMQVNGGVVGNLIAVAAQRNL